MNKSLSKKDKADLALDLYLNTDKSQKEICEIIGWSQKTFTNYKEKNNWAELRSASALTPSKIIKRLYQRLDQLTEEGRELNADSIIKVAKSIESIKDNKTSISAIINTFKEFTTFLMSQDPEFAKKVNVYQKSFVNHKINSNK